MMLRKGQLQTIDQAVVTPRQHSQPCVDCPFGRIAAPGWLAGQTPEWWVQAAVGEVKIECHTMLPHQCVGAAMFRGNICKAPRDETLLVMKGNRKLVFSNPQEFLKHHKGKIKR